MIYCSNDWKKEIKKIRNRLKKSYLKRSFTIEKNIFISAFIIRKLIESDKMSTDIEELKLKAVVYPPLKHMDIINCCVEEENYDWEKGIITNVKLKDACNYLIHSYAFLFMYRKRRRVEHFFVSSDYDRNKHLYKIEMKDWINVLTEVSNDWIVTRRMNYNEKDDDYIATIKCSVKEKYLK